MTQNNENGILIVTDSAADIPKEVLDSLNIVVVPLHVYIDGQHYLDGVDIIADDFYKNIDQSADFPKTAPPTEEDFHQVFLDNIGAYDILGIFLSGKMSQTFNVASKTKMNNYGRYIRERAASPGRSKKFQLDFVDSHMVSMGTGLLVVEAANKAKEGWSFNEIKKHIEEIREQVGIYLMVNSLDHLVRGGRIGKATAMVGKLLDFKPLLSMEQGGIVPRAKSMGVKRAHKRIIELIKDQVPDLQTPMQVAVCSAGVSDDAALLVEMVKNVYPDLEVITSDFGPGVGTHTGPGAIGIAFLPVK